MTKRRKAKNPSPMQLLRRARRSGDKTTTFYDTGVPEVPVSPFINVWAVRSIEEQPHIEMVRWRVFEVNGGRVLFGYSLTNGWGRRSSAITAVDPQRMRVTTASGRIYQLCGPSGWDDDAAYLLEMSGLVAEYTEVTKAFCEEHGIPMELQ